MRRLSEITDFLFLVNTEPPDRVENLRASSIESRSAVISWTIDYTGNSLITSFSLEYKTSHSKPWTSASSTSESPVQSVSGTANSITLKKLKPLTTYHVRVRAQNGMGWSEFSEILSFTTDEEGECPSCLYVYSRLLCSCTFKFTLHLVQCSFVSVRFGDFTSVPELLYFHSISTRVSRLFLFFFLFASRSLALSFPPPPPPPPPPAPLFASQK